MSARRSTTRPAAGRAHGVARSLAARHPGARALAALPLAVLLPACAEDDAAIVLPAPSVDAAVGCFERAGAWDEADFAVELALADGAASHRGWLLGRSSAATTATIVRLDDRGEVESTWTWPLSGALQLRGIAPGVRTGTALVESADAGDHRLTLLDANAGADPLAAITVSFDTLYSEAGQVGTYTVQYAASADRTLLMLGPKAAPDLGLSFLLLELDARLDVAEAWTVFYDPGLVALPSAMADMIEGRPMALPSLPLTVFPYARQLVEVDPAAVEPVSIFTMWIGRIRGDRGTVEIVDPVVIEAGYTDAAATSTPDVIDAAADPTTTWYLYDDAQAAGDALLVAIDDVRDVAVLAQLDDVGVTNMRLLQLADGVALIRHLVGDDTIEVTRISRDYDPIAGQINLTGETAQLDASRDDGTPVVGLRMAGVAHLLVDYADGRSRLQGVRCVPPRERSRVPHVRSTIERSTRSPGAEPS
jgi:hypothetical protein